MKSSNVAEMENLLCNSFPLMFFSVVKAIIFLKRQAHVCVFETYGIKMVWWITLFLFSEDGDVIRNCKCGIGRKRCDNLHVSRSCLA